jgi:hypothetical protein
VKRYNGRLGYIESKQLIVDRSLGDSAAVSLPSFNSRQSKEIYISRLTSGNAIISSQLSLPLQLWDSFWYAMKEGMLTAEKSLSPIIKEEWKGVLCLGVLKASKRIV